jgi:hypothetical protein
MIDRSRSGTQARDTKLPLGRMTVLSDRTVAGRVRRCRPWKSCADTQITTTPNSSVSGRKVPSN